MEIYGGLVIDITVCSPRIYVVGVGGRAGSVLFSFSLMIRFFCGVGGLSVLFYWIFSYLVSLLLTFDFISDSQGEVVRGG